MNLDSYTNTCDYTIIVQIWWQYVNFLTIKGNLILLIIVRTVGNTPVVELCFIPC